MEGCYVKFTVFRKHQASGSNNLPMMALLGKVFIPCLALLFSHNPFGGSVDFPNPPIIAHWRYCPILVNQLIRYRRLSLNYSTSVVLMHLSVENIYTHEIWLFAYLAKVLELLKNIELA